MLHFVDFFGFENIFPSIAFGPELAILAYIFFAYELALLWGEGGGGYNHYPLLRIKQDHQRVIV